MRRATLGVSQAVSGFAKGPSLRRHQAQTSNWAGELMLLKRVR